MDTVVFFDSNNIEIETRNIEKIVYISIVLPQDAVGFTYYHADDEKGTTYVVGKQLDKLDVVKKVNEKLYERFIEFGKDNEGAKYVIGSINGQVYLRCCALDTVIVSSKKELQECLFKELGLEINKQKKK